jgi:GntR family transcriptional regulator/MocR family aminotransferase
MPRRTNPPPTVVPLRLQIYRQLRAAIEQGSFAPGARLPPSRDHAGSLGVSRNTVLWALQRLQAEGYVVARVGDGSYVAPDLPGLRTAPRARGVAAPRCCRNAVAWWPTPHWAGSRPWQQALPFRIGAPEVARFPFALWDRLARQIGPAERQALAQYLDPAGLAALREAIAQWLWVSRGVRCDAAQVLVCSGSQQALDLVGRLLLDPGDEVMVEDPGYPGIRAALAGPWRAWCGRWRWTPKACVIDDGARAGRGRGWWW